MGSCNTCTSTMMLNTTGALVTSHTHGSVEQLCLGCSGSEASASLCKNIDLTVPTWECEAGANSVDFMLEFGRPAFFEMHIWEKGRGRQGQAAPEKVRTAWSSSVKVSAFALPPSHFFSTWHITNSICALTAQHRLLRQCPCPRRVHFFPTILLCFTALLDLKPIWP